MWPRAQHPQAVRKRGPTRISLSHGQLKARHPGHKRQGSLSLLPTYTSSCLPTPQTPSEGSGTGEHTEPPRSPGSQHPAHRSWGSKQDGIKVPHGRKDPSTADTGLCRVGAGRGEVASCLENFNSNKPRLPCPWVLEYFLGGRGGQSFPAGFCQGLLLSIRPLVSPKGSGRG